MKQSVGVVMGVPIPAKQNNRGTFKRPAWLEGSYFFIFLIARETNHRKKKSKCNYFVFLSFPGFIHALTFDHGWYSACSVASGGGRYGSDRDGEGGYGRVCFHGWDTCIP